VIDRDDLRTGVLFREQAVGSLVDAIRRFEGTTFEPERLRSHAMTFDKEVYKRKMKELVLNAWREFSPSTAGEKG
jgi:hypothetical protein